MIAVFHRQWKALAHSKTFYLFLTLVALGLGGLIAMFHGSYQYANFEFVLWYFSVLFAFLLPILTLHSFSEERKNGTGDFLKALPISAKEIVLGKLLAGSALLLVISVVLLVIPILLGLWGSVYYPSAYVAIFAFFLFSVAMLALDTFLALMFKNSWVALGVTYAVMAAMLGLYYLSALLPTPLSEAATHASVFGSYSSFVFGMVDLSAIALYLSIGALFGFLSILFANKVWKE